METPEHINLALGHILMGWEIVELEGYLCGSKKTCYHLHTRGDPKPSRCVSAHLCYTERWDPFSSILHALIVMHQLMERGWTVITYSDPDHIKRFKHEVEILDHGDRISFEWGDNLPMALSRAAFAAIGKPNFIKE